MTPTGLFSVANVPEYEPGLKRHVIVTKYVNPVGQKFHRRVVDGRRTEWFMIVGEYGRRVCGLGSRCQFWNPA